MAVGCLAAPAAASADAERQTLRRGGLLARIGPARVVLGNRKVRRVWAREPFATARVVDRRGRGHHWLSGTAELSLELAGSATPDEAWQLASVRLRAARRSLSVEMTLRSPAAPGVTVTRTTTAYRGVAGFRGETLIAAQVPVEVSGATVERLAVGPATPALHSFRAGADWREPDYPGPAITVGDPRAGTWRETSRARIGGALAGPGQWLSLRRGARSVFSVLEANDFPSVRAGYDGEVGSAGVDYSRDVVSLGPFEEFAHVENPRGTGGRTRTVTPGSPLELPAVFTGLGRTPADEPWQFHRYLTGHRLRPKYPRAVTFNSNLIDENRISTGAKDDMDLATVREVAPVARRLGVETFILDDGWQARSGDWQPDSPQHPEPRWDGDPESKFAPRFPDPEFRAVRRAIRPMRLGLWMSPTFFNPAAAAYRDHPEWACEPVAGPLVAQNEADPDGGSNEAGLGPWSTAALPHVEARIREAIEGWRVRYFKFDFLVWLDCAAENGVRDLYAFREAFLAMLDRLRRVHPRVTFQIDETNDFRLFPFESVARGPTWFQNGQPPVPRMLHNLWNLSPYVPAFSLGQNALADEDFARYPVRTLMASSLLSHVTFFSDVRELRAGPIDRIRRWTRFYQRRRGLLDGVVYPLLEDPLEDRWTALQSWDPSRREGALLVFRQGGSRPLKRIALRNVPSRQRFELLAAPSGRRVGVVGSRRLANGLPVRVSRRQGSRVLIIRSLR